MLDQTATALFSVELPIPPSSNNMFTNLRRGGRIKSREYKAWRDIAVADIHERLCRVRPYVPIDQPCDVAIELPRPNKNSDVDNRIKAVLDALQHGGAIANDKCVEAVLIRWTPALELKTARVAVWPALELTATTFDRMFDSKGRAAA